MSEMSASDPLDLETYIGPEISIIGHHECHRCGMVLESVKLLCQHLSRTHDDVRFRCKICNHGFHRLTRLKKHLLKHSAEGPIFKCDICEKLLSSAYSLRAHQKVKHGVSDYCMYCDERFHDCHGLQEHVKNHPPVKCTHCCQTFETVALFEGHFPCNPVPTSDECSDANQDNINNTNTPVEFIVENANSTSSKTDLVSNPPSISRDDNVASPHGNNENSTLVKTVSQVESQNDPKSESKAPSSQPNTPRGMTSCRYKCPVCDALFGTVKLLVDHRRKCHADPKLICVICNQAFTDQTKLNFHHLKKHAKPNDGDKPRTAGSKNFKCPVCDCAFPFHSSLRRHMKNHNEKDRQKESEKEPQVLDCNTVLESNPELSNTVEGVAVASDTKIHPGLSGEQVNSRSARAQKTPISKSGNQGGQTKTKPTVLKKKKKKKKKGSVKKQSQKDPNSASENVLPNNESSITHASKKKMPTKTGSIRSRPNARLSRENGDASDKNVAVESGEKGEKDATEEIVIKTEPEQENPNEDCPEINDTRRLGRSKCYRYCSKCDKIIDEAHTHRQHLMGHLRDYYRTEGLDDSGCTLTCPVCSGQYRRPDEKFDHIISDHIYIHIFKCKKCEMTFSNRSQASTHTLARSCKQKRFICNVCKVEAKDETELSRHMDGHAEMYPVKCDLCPWRFKRTYLAKYHVLTHEKSPDNSSYNCSQCDQMFTNTEALRKHLTTHKKTATVQNCSVCGLSLPNPRACALHEKSHHPKEPLQCSECGKEFPTKAKLRYHMHEHQGVPYFKCAKCQAGFFLPKGLRNHLKKGGCVVASGSSNCMCGKCERSFSNVDLLRDHVRSHEVARDFLCSICGRAFTLQRYLNKHFRKVHNEENATKRIKEDPAQTGIEIIDHPKTPFRCTFCKRLYSRKQTLKDHVKSHLVEPEFQCEVCDKLFHTKSMLSSHKRNHSTDKPHQCPTCGKAFKEKSHLIIHMRIHADERPFVCSVCGLSFKQNSALRRHVLAHDGAQKFPCNICGLLLSAKIHLKNHLLIHTKSKPHACETCGKRFRLKATLRSHNRIHQPSGNFACSLCPKVFSARTLLRMHQQRHKSYTCNLCQSVFYDPRSIRVHMRGHEGAVLHTCDICGKQFFREDMLKFHKNSHVALKPHQCSHCPKGFLHQRDLKMHEVTHSDPAFGCEHCDKMFRHKISLKKHMASRHSAKVANAEGAMTITDSEALVAQTAAELLEKLEQGTAEFTTVENGPEMVSDASTTPSLTTDITTTLVEEQILSEEPQDPDDHMVIVESGNYRFTCKGKLEDILKNSSVDLQVIHTEEIPETPETVIQDTEPETVIQDTEPETVIQDTEPETVIQDTEPETVIQEAEPETVIQDTEPETVIQDTEPDTVIQDTVPETVIQDTEPETVIQDTEPETVNQVVEHGNVPQEAEPETVIQDSEPETVIQEAETETVTQEIELVVSEETNIQLQEQSSEAGHDTEVQVMDMAEVETVSEETLATNSLLTEQSNVTVFQMEEVQVGEMGEYGQSLVCTTEAGGEEGATITYVVIETGENLQEGEATEVITTDATTSVAVEPSIAVATPPVVAKLESNAPKGPEAVRAARQVKAAMEVEFREGMTREEKIRALHTCQVCGKYFPRRSQLKNHVLSHTTERPYQCAQCGASFKTNSTMNKHVKSVHDKIRDFICQSCGKAFHEKGHLTAHMQTHSNEKPFVCNTCGKSFNQNGTLKRHQMVHSDLRPHMCSYCRKWFREASHLRVHVRSHTGERPFTCRVCEKAFACASTRKQHERLHSGARPYKCPYCDKCFIAHNRRQEHVNTIHLNMKTSKTKKDKPFVCLVCTKSYTSEQYLNTHLQKHGALNIAQVNVVAP